MKKITLVFTLFLVTSFVIAQENDKGARKEKKEREKTEDNRDKDKHKDKDGDEAADQENENEWKKKVHLRHSEIIWAGTSRERDPYGKPAKNQPHEVAQSFHSQFPNATNTVWTKYRGEWVATFSNAVYTTTVIYGSDGQIKETRTVATPADVPEVVMKSMEKYKSQATIGDIVKIEKPGSKEIYRFALRSKGKPQFRFVNTEGNEISYDY